MFTKPRLFYTLSLVLFTALMGCSNQKSTLEKLGGEEPSIISTRPQGKDFFIAIVKLKSPALFNSAVRENGLTKVDPEALKALEEEQAQAIADMKALSSDIRVLFRYRMVLNGLAIVAPKAVAEQLRLSMNVSYVEREGQFARPKAVSIADVEAKAIPANTSVKFIGADKVHQLKVLQPDGSLVSADGKGTSVGIIDTGIDYTHAMFGGVGTEDAFKAIDPSKPGAGYPNAKVVGGIDLTGTAYNMSSGDFSAQIPKPDENPIDEGGHGTHVAGTVAGFGDNTETYSGVAPGSLLHAIKVFGADGSTGDAVVIAALEYAADPNRDGDLKDQLDVVNLSLGSAYGQPHVLYGQAIRSLTLGGTVVVASAGNEGNLDNITGSPAALDEALSVAAGIDNMDHNWKFRAVKFVTPTAGEKLTEAVEGPISKPVAEAGNVSGALIFLGLANEELTEVQKAAVKGKVALIDRGVVTFAEKIKRAHDAGAVGVVVANNADGNAFAMGGDGNYPIPAIMITRDLGALLKEQMTAGDVVIHFQTSESIEKPELIDTLTDFSSKGPRSIDSVLKPEVTAPGASIISAKMGGGAKGVQMSGTSMSGPHVAGVMALMKQIHPALTVQELKSLVMGRATTISDSKKEVYPLSRQGAGRVQTFESANAVVVANKVALSLGEVDLESKKLFRDVIQIRNISKSDLPLKVRLDTKVSLAMAAETDIVIKAGEVKTLPVEITVSVPQNKERVTELDGLILLEYGGREIHRIPVLAVVKKIAAVQATSLAVKSSSAQDSAMAATDLTIRNQGVHAGKALAFNLLGTDARKQDPRNDPYLSKACDLQAAGYRIVTKDVDGQQLKVLQVGVKLFEPMTTWNFCEVSVLIDSNGDEKPEQELAGIPLGNVPGLSSATNENQFTSVLFDAAKVRELRKAYELESAKPVTDPEQKKPEENYTDAAIDAQALTVFNHSTVMVLEADVTKLSVRASGELAIKVATLFGESSSVEQDDYLGSSTAWGKISLNEKSHSFFGMPEVTEVAARGTSTVAMTKGYGSGRLLMLLPENRSQFGSFGVDDQLQILKPSFGF